MVDKKKLFLLLGIVIGLLLYFLVISYRAEGLLLYLVQLLLLLTVIYLVGAGADILVHAAERISLGLGISPLVVGLTVVAFGTSAPETAATILAGIKHSGDIAVANIVGSNFFNLCFILGGVAIVSKGGIEVDRNLLRRDGPFMAASSVILFIFVGSLSFSPEYSKAGDNTMAPFLDRHLQLIEGVILLALLFIYLLLLYRMRKTVITDKDNSIKLERDRTAIVRDFAIFLFGLGLVLAGCHILVGKYELIDGTVNGYGALWFAHILKIPDYIVGITIVAAGTSAPELVVSIAAGLKGKNDMAIGNLLGSSIFNVLAVMGLAGVILQPPLSDPVIVSAALIPPLIGLTLLTLLIILFMWSRRNVSRTEGVVLVLTGIAFLALDLIF